MAFKRKHIFTVTITAGDVWRLRYGSQLMHAQAIAASVRARRPEMQVRRIAK